MKIGSFLVLALLVGCSGGRRDNVAMKGPAKVNDFYFEILEIKTSLHQHLLDRKPWIALKEEPAQDWSLDQISEWISLRYSKDVEKAKLRLLKSHLNTADPKLAYTKDIEETCWSEVERLVKSQLLKTALVVSQKAKLSPNRTIQEVIHDSIAARTP
ncbi:MAG: hypothetical protein VW576_08500 [Opitutae bacterium]